MKINPTTQSNKLMNKFDRELKEILLQDLSAFRQSRGQFLRNSGNNQQAALKSLLVA